MERYTLSELGRMENLPSRQTLTEYVRDYEAEHGEGSFTNLAEKGPGGAKTYALDDINKLLAFKGYKPIRPAPAKPAEVEVLPREFNSLDFSLPSSLPTYGLSLRPANIIPADQLDAFATTVEILVGQQVDMLTQAGDEAVTDLVTTRNQLNRVRAARRRLERAEDMAVVKTELLGVLTDQATEELADERKDLLKNVAAQESQKN